MRVFSNSKRKSLRRGAWRQGICVLLSVLLLFSVTACGKKDGAGTDSAESGSTGAEAAQAAPGGNSTGKGKEAASAGQTGQEIEIPEKPRKTEDGGISMDVFAMDTYMTLLAYGENAEEAILAAAAEIHRLDDLLSTGNPESEISKLNAAGGGTISADVEELIARAGEIHTETGGLFDISIYPVMRLWGFPTQEYRVPDKTEIEETLKLVDAAQITVTEVPAAGQAATTAPDAAQTAAPSEGTAPAAEGTEPAAAPAADAAAPAADAAAPADAPAEESAPAAEQGAPAETAPAADGSAEQAAEATGEVEAPAAVEAQAAAPQRVYVQVSAAENAEAAPSAENTDSAAGEVAQAAAEGANAAVETGPAETAPAEENPAADAAAPAADAAAPAADAAAPADGTAPAADAAAPASDAAAPASDAAAPAADAAAPAAENAAEAQTEAPVETETKVSFGITGMEIDLGGIAKGYTSSRVMDIFREHGVKHGLVSLGGNVQAIGTKKNGKPWRVAIQNPESEMEYLGVLNIEDKCVITSGGYERYFEKDGVHYHHIIDPRTGYPADSGLISATIISDDGALADGLSTSLFIMGKDEAEKYWREHADDFDYILEDEDGTLYVTEGADEILTTDNRTIVIRK